MDLFARGQREKEYYARIARTGFTIKIRTKYGSAILVEGGPNNTRARVYHGISSVHVKSAAYFSLCYMMVVFSLCYVMVIQSELPWSNA
jgi:hypothetical protein